MRIPITKYGLPQVVVYPALVLVLMTVLFILMFRTCISESGCSGIRSGIIWFIAAEAILFLIFTWMLMFFRDPPRKITINENILYSPADGTITDISETDIPELDGRVLRISMFLSIFNVHINRMPCSVKIDKVTYKKGKFKNAMQADSGTVNEANEVLVTRLSQPKDRLLIRQVSGAVARRIVCKAVQGQEYLQGEIFGMIKFGSRTELFLPLNKGSYDITVKIGDKVNAGLSPLVIYK